MTKIIPATPGFQLLAARVVNDVCEVSLTPIIAWRVLDHTPSLDDDDKKFEFGFTWPVLPIFGFNDDEENKTHFVVWPNGNVSDGGHTVFESIDSVKKFLVNWQREANQPKRRASK